MYLVINDYNAKVYCNEGSVTVAMQKNFSPKYVLGKVISDAEKLFSIKVQSLDIILAIPSEIDDPHSIEVMINIARILRSLCVDVNSVSTFYSCFKPQHPSTIINIGNDITAITVYGSESIRSHNIFSYNPHKIIESIENYISSAMPHVQHKQENIKFILERYLGASSHAALEDLYRNYHNRHDLEMYLFEEHLGNINDIAKKQIIDFTKKANKYVDKTTHKHIIADGFIAGITSQCFGARTNIFDFESILEPKEYAEKQSFVSGIASLFKFDKAS